MYKEILQIANIGTNLGGLSLFPLCTPTIHEHNIKQIINKINKEKLYYMYWVNPRTDIVSVCKGYVSTKFVGWIIYHPVPVNGLEEADFLYGMDHVLHQDPKSLGILYELTKPDNDNE